MDKSTSSTTGIIPSFVGTDDNKMFDELSTLEELEGVQDWNNPLPSLVSSSPATVSVNLFVKRSSATQQVSTAPSSVSTLPVSSLSTRSSPASSLSSSSSTPAIVTTMSNPRSGAPASAYADLISRGRVQITPRLSNDTRRVIARHVNWDVTPVHILLCLPAQLAHVSPKFLSSDVMVTEGTDLVVTVSNLPACQFASSRKKRCYKASPLDKQCLCGPGLSGVRKRQKTSAQSDLSGSSSSGGGGSMSDSSSPSPYTASPIHTAYSIGLIPGQVAWSSPEFALGALHLGSGGGSGSGSGGGAGRIRHGTGSSAVHVVTALEWEATQQRLAQMEMQIHMLVDTVNRLATAHSHVTVPIRAPAHANTIAAPAHSGPTSTNPR